MSGKNIEKIKIGSLSSGVYVLKARFKNSVDVKKIVVE
jgi:hypothetical protein